MLLQAGRPEILMSLCLVKHRTLQLISQPDIDTVYGFPKIHISSFVQAEELRQAILSALIEKQASERLLSHRDAKLRTAAESIQLEDWAIDFNQVCMQGSTCSLLGAVKSL
jgi:hypothetical protein